MSAARHHAMTLESFLDCVASVPVLPGCVSQGDSRAAALANIREAIKLYIVDCIAGGDPVPVEVGRSADLTPPG